MLNAFEEYLSKAKLSIYQYSLVGQLDENLKIISNCAITRFEGRRGKIYLKLDANAKPVGLFNKKESGESVCKSALNDICNVLNIQSTEGYRVANLPGYVEILPPLQVFLLPPPSSRPKP